MYSFDQALTIAKKYIVMPEIRFGSISILFFTFFFSENLFMYLCLTVFFKVTKSPKMRMQKPSALTPGKLRQSSQIGQ